eukprot:Rmarinus@m.12690
MKPHEDDEIERVLSNRRQSVQKYIQPFISRGYLDSEDGIGVSKDEQPDASYQGVGATSGESVSDFYSRVVNTPTNAGVVPGNDSMGVREKEKIFCSACNESFSPEDQLGHLGSTLHAFNSHVGSRPPRHNIHIPSNNVGYQLLQRAGWDAEKGLGIDEQGRMEPVPTTLKIDRKGLGKGKQESRVTHFPSCHRGNEAEARASVLEHNRTVDRWRGRNAPQKNTQIPVSKNRVVRRSGGQLSEEKNKKLAKELEARRRQKFQQLRRKVCDVASDATGTLASTGGEIRGGPRPRLLSQYQMRSWSIDGSDDEEETERAEIEGVEDPLFTEQCLANVVCHEKAAPVGMRIFENTEDNNKGVNDEISDVVPLRTVFSMADILPQKGHKRNDMYGTRPQKRSRWK